MANFSGPYGFLQSRGGISEDVRNHQFRFKDIVDPSTAAPRFALEHEVRSCTIRCIAGSSSTATHSANAAIAAAGMRHAVSALGSGLFESELQAKWRMYHGDYKELLDILACPKCKGDIHLNDMATDWFVTPAVLCIRSKTTFR